MAGDDARIFASIPTMKRHKDILAAAGIDFDAGHGRADFHALRHTLGTILSKAGVAPRVAMELMRHTDLRLTMKVYTDPRVFDLSGAVESLPGVEEVAQAKAATGTDGKAAGGVAVNNGTASCQGAPVNCTVSGAKSVISCPGASGTAGSIKRQQPQ